MTEDDAVNFCNKKLKQLEKKYGKVKNDQDERVVLLHHLKLYVENFEIEKLGNLKKITVHVVELPRFKRLDLDNAAMIVSGNQSFVQYYAGIPSKIM